MTITPEVVEAYKIAITKPKENGLPFEPIQDLFEKSETVTAKHILAKQYAEYIAKPIPIIPKLILYIIMNELFGPYTATDENGNLGYYLKFKEVVNY